MLVSLVALAFACILTAYAFACLSRRLSSCLLTYRLGAFSPPRLLLAFLPLELLLFTRRFRTINLFSLCLRKTGRIYSTSARSVCRSSTPTGQAISAFARPARLYTGDIHAASAMLKSSFARANPQELWFTGVKPRSDKRMPIVLSN